MASSSFIDANARIAALGNAIQPGAQPGTSLTPSSDMNASFQNQQLGGILSKTSSQIGGPPGSQQPQAVGLQNRQPQLSPVAQIANTTLDSVKAASARLNSLAAVQASKRQERLSAAQGASAGGYSGGGYSGGINYSANKNLSSARNTVMKNAFSYVGDPYVLGGTSHAGIDCSGLVMALYDQFGYGKYVDNHSSRLQGQIIPGVRTSVSNLQPGDIVAWRDGSHIAIYAGNGMIVSAADYGEGVKYQPVWGDVYGIHLTLPGE